MDSAVAHNGESRMSITKSEPLLDADTTSAVENKNQKSHSIDSKMAIFILIALTVAATLTGRFIGLLFPQEPEFVTMYS